MGKIPGGDRAYVEPAKIAGYLLNPDHRLGQHKARVFAASLGLRLPDAESLISALKQAAIAADAEFQTADQYGARYTIRFIMDHVERSAEIISVWIIRPGEDFPRFVTATVAKQENQDE
jgi:uncharacterized protein DUF6883